MPNGKDTMAQAVYLAQLQACKGSCKCNVCQILRKAADRMSEDFLNPTPAHSPDLEQAIKLVRESGISLSDTVTVEEG